MIKPHKQMLPLQPGDVPATYTDVAGLMEDFDYNPNTSYTEGITRFEGIQRREKLEYPFEALKEIIINVLIHRDYSNTSNLQIKVFNDKISFTNGAFLPHEITIEKLKQSHASVPMNPLIASVFYKAGLIENWGRGTINIINYCADYKIPEPEFRFDMSVFWVILNNDTDNDTDNDTNTRAEKIIHAILKNSKISTKQLSIICSVSQITIKRDIDKLKTQKKLKRIGDKRTGYWEITKK